MALTIINIRVHPFCNVYVDVYRRFTNLMPDIGVQNARKRIQAQEKYLRKRRARMDVKFRAGACVITNYGIEGQLSDVT